MMYTRFILTTTCCAIAMVCAIAASYEEGIFGHTSTGLCIEVESTLEEDCAVTNTGPQCKVWIEGSLSTGPNQMAPAYFARLNIGTCITPLRRPL